MEEKGRPWLSKLGVATETTGVVSEWVDWETPRRWALFCREKAVGQEVAGGGAAQALPSTPRPRWRPESWPRWDAGARRPRSADTETLRPMERDMPHAPTHTDTHAERKACMLAPRRLLRK